MPDLNLRNPEVTAELQDVARQWLDLGVDGFRLDAAQHLVEEDGVYANTPDNSAWLAGFDSAVKAVRPDALLVGEVWADSTTSSSYVPHQVDLTFDFPSADAAAKFAVIGDADALLSSATDDLTEYPQWQAGVFTDNHDRARLASLAFDDPDRLRLIATWQLTQPGVPFLLYGQELGLPGQKPDERIRSPLPWSDDAPAAGFTTGKPWEPLQGGWRELNVAAEQADPHSLLHLYQRLIRVRAQQPALRTGSYRTLKVDEPGGFAYLRTLADEQVLVLGNASAAPIHGLTVRLPARSRGTWTSLLGPALDQDSAGARFTPVGTLQPWDTVVLRRVSAAHH
jgi:alpha-amylase